MLVEYTTVAGPGEAVLVEKKSKFIAQVRPCPVRRKRRPLEEVRKPIGRYPQCSGLYHQHQPNIQKFSDDGNLAALRAAYPWRS